MILLPDSISQSLLTDDVLEEKSLQAEARRSGMETPSPPAPCTIFDWPRHHPTNGRINEPIAERTKDESAGEIDPTDESTITARDHGRERQSQ